MSTTTMHNEDRIAGGDPIYRMTTEEAAVRLQVTVGRIKQLCWDGTLDAIKTDEPKYRWMISEQSVERYDESRRAIERIRQNMKGGATD